MIRRQVWRKAEEPRNQLPPASMVMEKQEVLKNVFCVILQALLILLFKENSEMGVYQTLLPCLEKSALGQSLAVRAGLWATHWLWEKTTSGCYVSPLILLQYIMKCCSLEKQAESDEKYQCLKVCRVNLPYAESEELKASDKEMKRR